MTGVILIRHAETDGNRNRYAGREDIPLNAHGLRQAQELALALSGYRFDQVLTSPLSRATQTAEPVAACSELEPQHRAGLMEVDYGSLQGNVKGDRPFSLRREYRDVPMPGGESLRDVWNRLLPISSEVADMVSDRRLVAIVGHYWSNRILAAMLTGLDFDAATGKSNYKPANASAYLIEPGTGNLRRIFSPVGT